MTGVMNAKPKNVKNANLFECDNELGALARKSWLAEQACVQDAYDFLDFWFFHHVIAKRKSRHSGGKEQIKTQAKIS